MVDEKGRHVPKDVNGYRNWGICIDESRCPIPPRRCGTVNPNFEEDSSSNETQAVDIRRQPWIASIGKVTSRDTWDHKCTGSIITTKHILTSATCAYRTAKVLAGYSIRMGSTTLDYASTERKIKKTHIHPEYKNRPIEFDVAIMEFNEEIEFSDYVQQVCLPFLPMDEEQYEDYSPVTISGYYNFESCSDSETFECDSDTFASLKISNSRIDNMKSCKERVSTDLKINSKMTRNIACTIDNVGDSPLSFDSGSPVVKHVSDTARLVPYYEQHFIVSTVSEKDKQVKVLTRITDRTILLWIQEKTDTSPLVMVVAGHSNHKEMKHFNTNTCIKNKRGKCKLKPGLINDVELIKLSSDEEDENICSKFVSPIFGFGYLLGKDKDGPIWENEAEILGHTGIFAKDTAIVCGGLNGDGDQKNCYEWDFMVNRWKSKKRHPNDGIKPMKTARDRAAATIDQDGNIWVIGGQNAETEGLTTTEIYDYQTKGTGKWREGPEIPNDLPGGLDSHCVVRIDYTRTMLIGGFHHLSEEMDVGGRQNDRTWIFNSTHWIEKARTSVARDRPACSLVNMPDGKVRVLVAGGCDGWCADDEPAVSSAEMYDPETNQWKKVADLPKSLHSAKMELLNNRPTTFGGYSNNGQIARLYQYYVELDKWRPHPYTELRVPRSSAAAFQVPRELFRC
jgi:N-acetylneuraminic acid mutarotase